MVLLTGLVGTVFVTALFAAALGGAWLLGRQWHVRNERLDANNGVTRGETAAQLENVARTLEALTLEVERVAEAQRYAARLLAERSGVELGRSVNDPMRPQERVVTPH